MVFGSCSTVRRSCASCTRKGECASPTAPDRRSTLIVIITNQGLHESKVAKLRDREGKLSRVLRAVRALSVDSR